MTNPIELLISLGVSDKASKDNINKYIQNLKTEDLGITLTIDGAKSNDKVIADMQKQIEKLQNKIKELNALLGNMGDSPRQPKIFIGVGKELEQVKGQIDRFLKKEGFENFDFKINADTSNGEKTLKNFVATVRDANSEISKLTFMPDGKGSFTEIKEQLNVTQISDYNKFLKDIDNSMSSIAKNGMLSAETISNINMEIARIKSNEDLTLDRKIHLINRQLIEMNNQVGKLKLDEEMEKSTKKLQNLESTFIRVVNTYKRETKNMDLSGFDSEFKRLGNIENITDPHLLREYNKEIDNLTGKVRRFQANVTEAMRGSLTLVDQFKVAMERFPIWMAASTAFFGVVRTAKEFGTIILDIDNKMTDLAKVMSEDTNFTRLFDNIVVSAEKASQSISATMDAYNEFAKQGYTEDQLTRLSDSALIASNVADLDTKTAAEYLTGTLIQFNMETEESMRIIDSWNQISNDYATSVQQIADGNMVAGATASAMGIEFDQLNSIIGTVKLLP